MCYYCVCQFVLIKKDYELYTELYSILTRVSSLQDFMFSCYILLQHIGGHKNTINNL